MRFNMVRAKRVTGHWIECNRLAIDRAGRNFAVLEHFGPKSRRKTITAHGKAFGIGVRERGLHDDLIGATLVCFILLIQAQILRNCHCG